MSQYRKTLPNGNMLMWGFDRMTAEYFISEFKNPALLKEDEDEEVFGIGTRFNITKDHPDFPGKESYSRGELLEIFNRYKGIIPEEHINRLALDMPL
jgi:hypothetical protein